MSKRIRNIPKRITTERKHSNAKQKLPALQEKLIHKSEQIGARPLNRTETAFCVQSGLQRPQARLSNKSQGRDFWETPQMRIKSLHIAKRPLPTRYHLYKLNCRNRCHNYNKKHEGFTEAMGLYAVQGRTSISLPFRYLVLTQLTVISSSHPGPFHMLMSSKCQGIKGDFCQSPLCFSTTPQISHKAPPNTSLCRSWQAKFIPGGLISFPPTVRVIVVQLAVTSFPSSTFKVRPTLYAVSLTWRQEREKGSRKGKKITCHRGLFLNEETNERINTQHKVFFWNLLI